MVQSVLSVLLFGMVPAVSSGQIYSGPSLQSLAVSPPAEHLVVQNYLTASGVVILDAQSGQILYAKKGDVSRPMASITKLMTALIIVENHDMDEIVKVPKGIESVVGNKAYLKSGEQFTVGDLLSALLIPSANDAAVALAVYHSGSTADFVEEMNQRADELGLYGTSYANPSGLDEIGQYSTPRDIAWLTMFARQNPDIKERMGTRWKRIHSLQGTTIALNHTHSLMHRSEYTDSGSSIIISGGKTGTTDEAKQCVVSVIELKGKQYIVVIMKSMQRYSDLRIILDTMLSMRSSTV